MRIAKPMLLITTPIGLGFGIYEGYRLAGGLVFLMIALGLYELFIDPNLDLPDWLTFSSFDDLKNKLIGVVIVVLAVLFLGSVVSWDGSRDMLGIGAGVALVIGALTYFLSTSKDDKGKPENNDKTRR